MSTLISGARLLNTVRVDQGIVERLVPIFDTRTGAHYSVLVRVDMDRLGKELGRDALKTKGKRVTLAAGAVEVKVNV